MLAVNKLKGKIVENNLTTDVVSNALGLHKSTFYRKLQGTSSFTVDEAEKLVNLLGLSSEEATDIFFAEDVADTRKT